MSYVSLTFGGILRYKWLYLNFSLSLRSIFVHLAQSTNSTIVFLPDLARSLNKLWLVVPKTSTRTVKKRSKTHSKINPSIEASKRVGELRGRKYYTRAAKKLEEEVFERLQSCEEEAATKKHRYREDILKSKNDAKTYKQTFPVFKRKMIEAYGEIFYYNGGSWHGEESRRYRHYHIRKSMRFLKENMNNSDDEWKEHCSFCGKLF